MPYSSNFIGQDIQGFSTDFDTIEPLPASGFNTMARAKRYGRWYILKGLRADIAADPIYQQMLRKEFEILISLQHPHIVQAYGMEEVEGMGVCIVMEWVDGETLASFLQDGSLTAPERRRVIDELTDALAAIHAQNIVHRDLKPANIMLTRNGHSVKLIDFGLADTDGHAILKQPAGTLPYMSAEQRTQSLPDVRNDLYSLGLIMRELQPGWRYSHIIRRCLAPQELRYQNVAQLQTALRRRRWLSRWLWLAGIALLVIVGEGVLLYQLAHVTANNAELEEQSHLARGVQMGRAAIDESIRKEGIDIHLDTLSRWAYHWPDLQERMFRVGDAVYDYTDGLQTMYTEEEIEQIREQLLAYWKAWYDQTIVKVRKMNTQP